MLNPRPGIIAAAIKYTCYYLTECCYPYVPSPEKYFDIELGEPKEECYVSLADDSIESWFAPIPVRRAVIVASGASYNVLRIDQR